MILSADDNGKRKIAADSGYHFTLNEMGAAMNRALAVRKTGNISDEQWAKISDEQWEKIAECRDNWNNAVIAAGFSSSAGGVGV